MPGIHHFQDLEEGLFIRRRGTLSASPSVLYIHGLGESGLCFEKLMTHPGLSRWLQLAPDLPGYGRSPWLDSALSLTAHADGLARFLRKWMDRPLVLVGHSMGGVVAQLLAERHGELVRGLLDVEGNISRPDCAFSSQAAAHTLADFKSAGFDDLRDRVYRSGLSSEAERGYYASLRLCDPDAFHRNSRELVRLSGEESLARRLGGLDLPVHYIAGLPGGACSRSLELLDEAGIAQSIIEPAGHWPFIDQPDAFVSALKEFITKTGASE